MARKNPAIANTALPPTNANTILVRSTIVNCAMLPPNLGDTDVPRPQVGDTSMLEKYCHQPVKQLAYEHYARATGPWLKSGLWLSCYVMSETVAATWRSRFGGLTMKDAT
jgi:hypothetical protein